MSLSLEIGTKVDDTLTGTDDTDILLGMKGDDVLDGGGGDDLLLGGKGDDTLDGGAGNDRLLAGKGDDTLNYTLSENIGDTDYYDGGKGFDTLQLTLTSAELLLVQDEIDAFRAFVDGGGRVFHFESFGLTVRGFEDLVIVEVGGGNTAPVAVNDSFEAVEDTALLIPVADLLANDSDAEGSALTATLVSGPSSGMLELSSDGSSYTYTPDLNFHGEDTFTYQVSDGELSSGIATVTIQVAPVNDAPVAADDLFAGDEDTVIEDNVLDNDVDVDGDALSATLVTGPQNGTLVLAADGSFTYTPNADFNGEDSFTYQANDGALADSATVMLQVAPDNDAPVAEDDVVPNTISAAIRVAVVGGVNSSYVDTAKQLSDSSAFNIAAKDISVTAHMTEEDWAAALSSYDVVVVGDSGFGTDYSNDNGVALYAALRDFLDDGGGIVSTGWSATFISRYDNAQLSDDADYVSPAAFSVDPFTTTEDIAVLDSSHAITEGIADSYAVQGREHELALIDGTAVELAEGTSGMTAVAYDDSFEFGKSVYLGSLHMANSFFNPGATRTGPADQIFEQAVAWAAGERPLVAATDEDTALVIDDEFLFGNDSDVDGDLLEIAEVMASVRGAAVSIDNGQILYDPRVSAELQALSAGEVVEDSFQYRVSDGQGGTSDWASVSLSVLGQADTIV